MSSSTFLTHQLKYSKIKGLSSFIVRVYTYEFYNLLATQYHKEPKGRGKPVQHLIQHKKIPKLDEMLDRFSRSQILKKKEKSCWMSENYVG